MKRRMRGVDDSSAADNFPHCFFPGGQIARPAGNTFRRTHILCPAPALSCQLDIQSSCLGWHGGRMGRPTRRRRRHKGEEIDSMERACRRRRRCLCHQLDSLRSFPWNGRTGGRTRHETRGSLARLSDLPLRCRPVDRSDGRGERAGRKEKPACERASKGEQRGRVSPTIFPACTENAIAQHDIEEKDLIHSSQVN